MWHRVVLPPGCCSPVAFTPLFGFLAGPPKSRLATDTPPGRNQIYHSIIDSITPRAPFIGARALRRATRGMHHCDRCPPSDDDEQPWGNAEGGADGTRFASPSLIHHYVGFHRYQPPVVFIAAVMPPSISDGTTPLRAGGTSSSGFLSASAMGASPFAAEGGACGFDAGATRTVEACPFR